MGLHAIAPPLDNAALVYFGLAVLACRVIATRRAGALFLLATTRVVLIAARRDFFSRTLHLVRH